MNKISPAISPPTPVAESHLSDREAVRITQQEDVPELVEFILALKMKRPVSTNQAAGLLRNLVMQQKANDICLIADQMRTDGWETHLSEGETFDILAVRISAYLSGHAGVALFNFFVKTFAQTSGAMFE